MNRSIHRYDISGEAWERIKELLPGQAGKCRGAAKDKRLFINATAWQTTHGHLVEKHVARIRELKQHA